MAPPRPLEVDPGILARIRAMRRGDLDEVCQLHEAAMGRSLWARLGRRFLRAVYEGLLLHPDFLGFVYVEDGRVRGFIAGTADTPRMFREVLQRRALPLALAALAGLLRRPAVALRLLETALYFRRSGVAGAEEIRAESIFCSFEPGLRGLRISGLINKVLFDELAARGHRYVKITTEADNTGAVRQLSSWGFSRLGSFRFYGKKMITWRLELSTSERVGGGSALRLS